MLTRSDLHEYQLKAIKYIKEKKRCALFLFMGAGKSVSALTAASDLLDGCAVERVLVIAPLRVANSVWAQECDKWAHLNHLKVSVCTGSERKRISALQRTADVYTINRENVPWLVKHYSKRWPFDAVIVDESSSFKSASSQRFKAMRKILPETEYMILLTGTPSPNGLLDLWAQMYLIDFGNALGRTMTAYKQRFFESDYMGYRWTIKPGAAETIHGLISDVCLSMSAADYLELPQRIDLSEFVELPPKVATAYQRFESDLLATLPDGEEVEAVNAAALANKLLQWCNGATYTDDKGNWSEVHSAKLDALAELVELNDEPMLVAYNYKTDLARIKARFPDAVQLDKDPETILRWNRGEIKMLLAHPACLHPRTEVLTEFRGWVRIIDVRKDERVYDGVEFVKHKGCSFSGIRPVIEVEGITLTPNHKLLVGGVWLEVKDVRSDPSFRGKAVYAYEGDDPYLSKMLPLSKGKCHSETELRQSKPTAEETLRGMLRGGFSPDDKYPFLENLATYGQPSDQSIRSRLPSIRGCWSRCFGGLVGFQKLLRGYVRHLPRPSDNRSDQQRFGVLKRKLSVGYDCCAAGEQIKQSTVNVYGEADAPRRVLSSSERFARGDNAEIKQRNDARASVRRLSCVEVPKESQVSEVYDLVDCGPRNRFLIRNDNGDVFISHNSTGHGLNLQQGGSLCVWFGLNWSLELYQQFNARLHRQGQTKPVRIVHIVARGCIDERVMLVLSDKDAVQSKLLSALFQS